MNKYELGIVDTRNILTTIKDVYDYDFKDYALTSLKRRIERILGIYNIRDAEFLIRRLKDDKEFFEVFLSEITVGTTEMFRDPGLWKILKESIIKDGIKKSGRYKIWVAGSESGEDLFSLMILLHEMNMPQNIQVHCGSICERNLEKIKSGYFDPKKTEVNDANYVKFQGKGDLAQYFKLENNSAYWDTSLIKNVIFTRYNMNFDEIPKSINLVIFRNQMIYYNQPYQDKVLKQIYDNLVPGGYLTIGAKETLEHCILNKKFKLIDQKERIFKRSIS